MASQPHTTHAAPDKAQAQAKATRRAMSPAFSHALSQAFSQEWPALGLALAVAINADFFMPMLLAATALVVANIFLTSALKTMIPKAWGVTCFMTLNCGALMAVPVLIEKNAPFWLMGIYCISKAATLWRQQQVGAFAINGMVLVIAAAAPYAFFNIKDEGLLTGVLVLGFFIVLWMDVMRRQQFVRSTAVKSGFKVEQAYDGILELDMHGKIVGANIAAAEMCAPSGQVRELFGQSFMGLLSLKTKSQTITTLKRLFGDDKVLSDALNKQLRTIDTLSLQPYQEGSREPMTVTCKMQVHQDPVTFRRSVIVHIKNNSSLDALKKDNEKQHLKIISLSKLASVGETAEGVSDELHKQLTMTQSRMKLLSKIIASEEFSQKHQAEGALQGIGANLRFAIKAVQVFSKNRNAQPFSYENVSAWLRDLIDTGSFHLRHKSLEVIYDEADCDLSTKLVFCQKDRLTQALLQVFRLLAEQVIASPSCHILLTTRMATKDLCLSFSIMPGQQMGSLGLLPEAGLDLAREVIAEHSGTLHCRNQSLKDIVTIRLPVADKQEDGVDPRKEGDYSSAEAESSEHSSAPSSAKSAA